MGLVFNFSFGIVTLIAIGVGYYLTVLERWNNIKTLKRENFEAGNFNVYHTENIETEYYIPGRLKDVLKEWPHGKFKLFRVKPGHDLPVFDDSLLNSTVIARRLSPDCGERELTPCSLGSIFNPHCMFDLNMTDAQEDIIDARDIITGEKSNYQAAFAKLANPKVVIDVWNSLDLPFNLKDCEFEHAFITNLDRPAITASFHANPITDSMAVQLVGRKTWLFLPSSTYVDLMRSTFAGSAIFPKNSIPNGKKGDVFVYTSQPGDILYFPQSYGHSVYTHAGPNLMINYRNFYPGNFLQQPIIWLSSFIELKIFGRQFTNNQQSEGGKKIMEEKSNVPFKTENVRVLDMYKKMCREERTGIDQQLMNIFDAEMAKY